MLPPRLPIATPIRIREYILTPPDYTDLGEGEREVEKKLSEDEKLELQAKIAEDQKAAAELQVEASRKAEKAAEAKERALAKLQPAPDKVNETVANQTRDPEPETGIDEQDVRNMLNNAHKGKFLKDVLNGVWKTLKDRGVDVKGFKQETAVEFACMLDNGRVRKIPEAC